MEYNDKILRIGFIGGSINSAVGYTHFVASGLDKKWQLVTGCFSRDEKENEYTGEVYRINKDKVYTDINEMLIKEKNNIDAVAILTPTPEHYKHIIACLNQDIPIICEKSLAMDFKEATEIMELINNKNAFLSVIYNYCGYPMIRELKNLISNGVLGDILHFQIEMPQESFIRLDNNGKKCIPNSWRLSDQKIPTIYLDLAVHIHSLIYYLLEEHPTEVVADQSSNGWFENIVDNVGCLIHYTNNIQGQVWFSKSALGNRNGLKIRIYGSKASAEWFQMNPEEMIFSHSDGKREIIDRSGNVQISNNKRYERFKAGHPAGFIEAFANLYSDIAECLIEYKKNGLWKSEEVFSGDIAVEGLRLLEAMEMSVDTKRWEKV